MTADLADERIGLSAGQFEVGIGPRMKPVDGRVLRPPTIEYSRGSTSYVDRGAWQVQPRGRQQLLKPARLTSFGVLIGPGRVDPRAVHAFVENLLGEGRNLGLAVPAVPAVPSQPSFFVSGGRSIEDDFDEAVNQAQQAFGSPAEIVFAFFETITDVYDKFKALGLMQAVATQAFKWDKIRNKTRDFSTILNVMLKVK